MPNYAIIVAAGKGRRFGELKQFYALRGRPILLYAADNFEKNKHIEHILVVVPKNRIKFTEKLIKKWQFKKVCNIIGGGQRRQDSVLNAVNTIKAKTGIVAIHDGVRPIVSKQLINKGITLCRKYKAVIFGTAVRDTVKEIKNHTVVRTLSRKDLYLIQTPQFFQIGSLQNAYKKIDLSMEYTDEAALLESVGTPVFLYKGDSLNIKITKRDDLKILDKIL